MTTTLLGVDDSKTMRKVIEITFAGEDFKTVLAENADDAMSKLSADRPNIVLVDAALEGTNGYDLCQRIKASSPGVGVVLLASKQQPYDRGRGSQVGADDFVDKPFDTQQLIDKISALARKLAGGTQSHPMATTQHGIGPAAAPAAHAPAPFPAPAAHAPQAVVSARPVSLDVGTRPRSPTLAYGNVNPMAPAGPGPVAPMIPSPSGPAPAARSNPNAAPPPAPAAARPAAPAPPAAPAYSPPTPAAYAAPTPPPPAPAAPAAAAAPIAAATAAATNGADFATKLGSLGLTKDQIAGVLALSREVVEKVVWEVVPTLAETLIKEEIKRLTAE